MATHCAWLSHLFSLFTYRTADLAKLFCRLSHIWDLSECPFLKKVFLEESLIWLKKDKMSDPHADSKEEGRNSCFICGVRFVHPARSLSRVERSVPNLSLKGWVLLVMGKRLQGFFLGRRLHSPFGGCSLGRRSGVAFSLAWSCYFVLSCVFLPIV